MAEDEHKYEEYLHGVTEKDVGLPPTETSVELMKYILDPKSKKAYEHITKDLAVTTLTPQEIDYINLNLQLLHLLTYIENITDWDLDSLKVMIDADIKGYAQVTRSKGGFERLAEITKALKQYQQFEEKKERKWF